MGCGIRLAARDATASMVRLSPAAQSWCGFEEEIVEIAPAPVLTWLEASDDRVLRRVEMFCRVLVRRIIAATDMTAFHAQSEMHPPRTGGETLFTALRRVRRICLYMVEMRALLGHCSLLCECSSWRENRGAASLRTTALIPLKSRWLGQSMDSPSVRAPDFPDTLDWIHASGRRLQLADFRGKLLLLDFWTYG